MKIKLLLFFSLFNLLCVSGGDTIYLNDLSLDLAQSGWKNPQSNTNIEGGSLKLGEHVFERGVGVHAYSLIALDLKGKAKAFHALVGVDDKMIGQIKSNPVNFIIIADGEKLYESGPLSAGDPPQEIHLGIEGYYNLLLEVKTEGNKTTGTFANWCDAYLITQPKASPLVFKAENGKVQLDEKLITEANDSNKYIIDRTVPGKPSINMASVYGTRCGKNIHLFVPVSGEKPFELSIAQLPEGLAFDSAKRMITGCLETKGEYRCLIKAVNALGQDEKQVTFKVGDNISLTPPMGWNSWNAFGPDINQDLIFETAKIMKSSGLIEHGWNIITIDDGWQGRRDTITQRITANKSFPDLKELTNSIHDMGLRAGIYSTPWVTSYMELPGGSADTKKGKTFYKRQNFGVFSFHEEDADQFNDWGFDYLKYDWAENHYPYARAMYHALKSQEKNIALSLSGALNVREAHLATNVCDLYRVNGDIVDEWRSVFERAFFHTRWKPFHGPGRWADPDMLVVGHVGWGNNIHASNLTPWEQVTHMSLWAMFSSPLILGCDLRELDDFTMALLSNDEIIEVNQDPLGLIADHHIAKYQKGHHVFVKKMVDGSSVVGLFNTSGDNQEFEYEIQDFDVPNVYRVRDLWERENLSPDESLTFTIPPHACKILRIYGRDDS